VLAGAAASAAAAGVVAALVTSFAGAQRLTAAGVLVYVLVAGGGTLGVLRWVASRTAPLEPAQLGLRPVPVRLALAGAGVAVAVLAAVAALVHPFGAAHPPVELSQRDAFAVAMGDPEPAVAFGPAVVASVLARAVLAVIVAEVVLRGFVLPVLARAAGLPAAVAIVSVLFAGLGGSVTGRPGLAVGAIVLGALLCWLYAETGSILPGIGVAAGATGALLAADFGWGVPAVLAQGVACALLAVAPRALGGPMRMWDLRPSTS
jgi:membrane protease YdiL (CAAX protease family)